MDIITMLIPFANCTFTSSSVERLVTDAKDDLICGRLKGLPLAYELPCSLLSMLIAIISSEIHIADVLKATLNSAVIHSWYHYSEFGDFVDRLLLVFDNLNKEEMCFVAEAAIEKSMKEMKEVRRYVLSIH